MDTDEFFRAYYAAWESLDLERVLDHFADDIEFEDVVVGAKATGLRQMRRFVQGSFDRVPEARFDYVGSHSTGTDYAVEWIMQPIGIRGVSIGRLNAAGKIAAQRDYWNGALFTLPDHP
jgi:SnoaL-like domain